MVTGELAMAGAVTGSVRRVLRLEGMAVLLAAGLIYAHQGHSWWLFLALFLAPDLSFLGYLAGAGVGAAVYNAAHSYVGPLAAGALSLLEPALAPVALIWGAHVGFDRALGYGLKHPTSFQDTHLGRIGRTRR
jgi:hypothetical protein